MTCRSDACRQGRDRCPTPECCCDEPAIGYEAARLIQDEITYAGDEPRTWWDRKRIGWWAAVIAVIGWAAIVHWG